MGPFAWAGAAAAAVAAYAFYEPYRYRLAHVVVPVARSVPALTVLHLSDTHWNPRDARLVDFLRSLPERLGRQPDIVAATGDLVEGGSGIDPLVDAISSVDARWGRFYVLGSHDYYYGRFRLPLKYFRGEGPRPAGEVDTEALEAALDGRGWVALTNTTRIIDTAHGKIRVAGVDDPYLKRHRTGHIMRAPDEAAAVGLVHAPDVVSQWLLAGFDLVLAGHTHAGQVRVPGIGALVTNCSLPTALGGGLHRVGNGWLHVSPGLGTGRYSPIRLACRPEATLLELTPAS